MEWAPYIKGAKGRAWMEPLEHLIKWKNNGLEKRILRHWRTVQCIRNSSRDVAPRLCSAANNSALQNRMVMKKNRCPKTSKRGATIRWKESSAKVDLHGVQARPELLGAAERAEVP